MNQIALHTRLRHIDLGNGVAEHDNLLRKCMVQTQHFSDLLFDRIDLVLGTKGAGKSSLFRVFGELIVDLLYKDHKTIVVSGVETMLRSVSTGQGIEYHNSEVLPIRVRVQYAGSGVPGGSQEPSR